MKKEKITLQRLISETYAIGRGCLTGDGGSYIGFRKNKKKNSKKEKKA